MPAKLPICLWSGPRNVSTALMYSFAQRTDMRVVDEPLYGHYLRVTRTRHPGREVVMAALDCNGDRVMRKLLRENSDLGGARLFMKHMAHHLVDLDLGFLSRTSNIFLIRDPREMLPSLTVQLPQAGLADTGLKRQCELYDELTAQGLNPAVIDSRELLLDPAGVLLQTCVHLGLAFEPGMLSWSAGPRPEDGVWASHWYDAVHRSTGFAPYSPKPQFPNRLRALLDECEPWYTHLYAHAFRTSKE